LVDRSGFECRRVLRPKAFGFRHGSVGPDARIGRPSLIPEPAARRAAASGPGGRCPMRSLLPRVSLFLALLAALTSPCGCGGGGTAPLAGPFTAEAPDEGPGGPHALPAPLPPPDVARDAVWDEDAVPFQRTALFGSFPSDVVRLGSTIFASDADAIEGDGASILAVDVSAGPPEPSARYATTVIRASDLVDSLGNPGDVVHPIGFGFFLNDLLVATDHLGFALANAGGSDSVPACSNLV